MGHNILIRTQDGQVVGFPKDFVVISTDGSPCALSLRCNDLAATANQADRKSDFAPNSATLRATSVAAHSALQDAGCETDDTDES